MANFAGNGLEALLAREYNKWTSPQAREAAVPLVLAYIHRTKSVASESIEFIKCLTKIATLIVKEEGVERYDPTLFHRLYEFCDEGIALLEKRRGGCDESSLRDAEFPMARMEAHLHAYKADAALFLYKATNDLEWAKKGYKGYMRSAELSRVVRGQRQVDEGHELYAYSIASEIAFKIFYELAIKYGLPVSLKLIAGLNDRNMTCDDRSNTLRFGIKDEELAHVIKWGNRCIESKSASGDKFRSKDRVRASLCYRDAAVVAADLFFYTENSQYLDTVLRSFKSSLSVLGKDNFEQRHDVTSDIRNFIQGYVKLDCYFNKGLKDKARISSLRDFAAFIYYDYSDNSEHVQPGAGDLVESISVNMNLGDLAKFVSTNSDSAFDIAKWAARARSAYTTAIKRYDQSSAAKADMVLTTHIAYALGFASSVSETLFSLFKNAERERASPSKVSSEIGIAEEVICFARRSAEMLASENPSYACITYGIIASFCNHLFLDRFGLKYSERSVEALLSKIEIESTHGMHHKAESYEFLGAILEDVYDETGNRQYGVIAARYYRAALILKRPSDKRHSEELRKNVRLLSARLSATSLCEDIIDASFVFSDRVAAKILEVIDREAPAGAPKPQRDYIDVPNANEGDKPDSGSGFTNGSPSQIDSFFSRPSHTLNELLDKVAEIVQRKDEVGQTFSVRAQLAINARTCIEEVLNLEGYTLEQLSFCYPILLNASDFLVQHTFSKKRKADMKHSTFDLYYKIEAALASFRTGESGPAESSKACAAGSAAKASPSLAEQASTQSILFYERCTYEFRYMGSLVDIIKMESKEEMKFDFSLSFARFMLNSAKTYANALKRDSPERAAVLMCAAEAATYLTRMANDKAVGREAVSLFQDLQHYYSKSKEPGSRDAYDLTTSKLKYLTIKLGVC